MEFINAPIGHNNLATKSHPKACYTSRLLDFTSKKLNEILESDDSQADLNDYENTCEKLNEILGSESSKKMNEILIVNEDLNDFCNLNIHTLDIYILLELFKH
ncbi:hypothetical protein RhiirC2_738063 [Rhizophagus irregularis]|uniref:Uncharacterized protein n=1 Tax=Rhizophagus irregularis TaxID=588596 RepID=A0A2N1NLG8_9GLOM|nr:hypothetical protein RhiirC2_738063 [Rhizophagus irregularis]